MKQISDPKDPYVFNFELRGRAQLHDRNRVDPLMDLILS